MVLKFKAYDSSTGRLYQEQEVFVCNGNIYVDDEDFDELIQNNDVFLFESTGMKDTEGAEIFSEDIVSQRNIEGRLVSKGKVKFADGCWVVCDEKGNKRKLYDYGVNTKLESEGYKNV